MKLIDRLSLLKRVSLAFIGALCFLSSVYATTLDQAVNQVKRNTGGKILSAKTVKRGAKRVHRIKVLTKDGKVRVVIVPAKR